MRRAILLMLALLMPLAAAAEEAAKPAGALTVREAGWRFFSGEQVVRTAMVDVALPEAGGDLRLAWRLSVGAAPVRGDTLAVPFGAAGGMPFTLAMPQVQRITDARLELSFERAGATLAHGTFALQIFPPRPAAPSALQGKKVVLLDPTGRTAAALGYLKIAYDEAPAAWTAVTGAADVFIVGDSVPADELARFLAAVQPRIAEGAVCVVLEQTHLDATRFPWLSLAPQAASWNAWEGPAGPAVLRGELAPEALIVWRDGGRSVACPMLTPARGNFTLLLEAIGAAQELPQTAALEVPCGKGRYVFSQLLIAHAFFDEPAARYVLANLLRYAATVPPHGPAVRAAVLADPQEERFARGFTPLGLKADVNPPALDGCGVVLVYGSEASAQVFRAQKAARTQALRDMVEAGGKLVLLDLRPETLDSFRGLWDGDVELAGPDRMGAVLVPKVEDKPLLTGVLPRDLEGLCQSADFPLISYRARRDGAEASARGVLVVAQGKGAVVFCQLPLPAPLMTGDADEAALRTYSQFLTNLNLILEDPNRRGVP